jgi:hypothetical protein
MCLSSSIWAAQTVVLLRHGEKPPAGLGQLTCQGLQRALALPSVLVSKYGRPSEILAPNPSEYKPDAGVLYAYIRPLATIEPTAIALEMPVNLSYSLKTHAALASYLLSPGFENSTFFIAWEHHQIDAIAKLLIAPFDPALASSVKHWADDDFDSIYKITLEGVGNARRASFSVEREDLNSHLPTSCPGPQSQSLSPVK